MELTDVLWLLIKGIALFYIIMLAVKFGVKQALSEMNFPNKKE